MAININTNVTSLFAQKALNGSTMGLADSMSRLSSGLRVRSAADDAAGLAVSEDFKAKIRSLNQANRNANDGVSLAQTADGALSEIGNMLGRMRELATQSRNGTLNDTQRGFLDDEFQELKSEIDRIVETTEFNGVALIDGTQAAGIEFQVGVGTSSNDRLTLSIADSDPTALSISSSTISATAGASAALTALDTAIEEVSTRRAAIGAMQNRLAVTMSNLDTYAANLSAANSRIVDVDVASETARLTRQQILVQAGASMLAQANQGPQIALSLLR
ncbi:MAG: flagellin FliC [Myxococcales bacterium FL481]|nr:MAG: flagellin FliC [Myxococcales bacterium FL481]